MILMASVPVVAANCAPFKSQLYPGVALSEENAGNSTSDPTKESIEALLADIWNSGFLDKNEMVKAEITNNRYGISDDSLESVSMYTSEDDYFDCKRGRACFVENTTEPDAIILKHKLFSHMTFNQKGESDFIGKDEGLHATFLHKLSHDFWNNMLTIDQQLEFSVESQIMYQRMASAKTDDDKVKFLRWIGYSNPDEGNFEPFEGMMEKKRYYSEDKWFGTELFARIAAAAYSGEIIVPKQLRKTYKGIISLASLDRSGL